MDAPGQLGTLARGRLAGRQLSADVYVASPDGELDFHAAPALGEEFANLVDRGVRTIVVDLLGVSFIDSTALGVLVQAVRRLRAIDGRMVVVCRDRLLLKVFEISGVAPMFSFSSSLSDALLGHWTCPAAAA